MYGPSQGRGCLTAEASALALNRESPAGAAITQPKQPAVAAVSLFDTCPLCGQVPVEPVRLEGQMSCRNCTSSCTACGAACVPGDEVCTECERLVHLHERVPA